MAACLGICRYYRLSANKGVVDVCRQRRTIRCWTWQRIFKRYFAGDNKELVFGMLCEEMGLVMGVIVVEGKLQC